MALHRNRYGFNVVDIFNEKVIHRQILVAVGLKTQRVLVRTMDKQFVDLYM
jgi:hypothetical protein